MFSQIQSATEGAETGRKDKDTTPTSKAVKLYKNFNIMKVLDMMVVLKENNISNSSSQMEESFAWQEPVHYSATSCESWQAADSPSS